MNSKLNALAEATTEKEYFEKGKMGTESKTMSIPINEEDIDIINEEDFKLNVYGKEVDWEIDYSEMRLYFTYSQE